jgi:DNA-binding response OmpR family regulator
MVAEHQRCPRVLLVDDAVDNVELYREYLSRRGYDVATASDGEEAVARAVNGNFDIAIVDIGLPKLDGLSVIMTLRSYNKTRRMRLVTLSALTGEKARAAAIDAGADIVLEKPCPPEEVELIVNTLVKL